MTSFDSSGDIAAAFIVLNEFLRTSRDRDAALQRLVDLAVDAVPGCDWAAITMWPVKRAPRTVASSGSMADEADQLQYELGEGPCLTASAELDIALLGGLEMDDRWPRFSRTLLASTPVRGVASFHLSEHPHRAALNLYTSRRDAFDADAVTLAALFAAHAQVLLIHASSSDDASNLQRALTTSRQIGAAVGILMNVHKVSEEHAFTLIRESSQRLNRKLLDVAVEVTYTGALPLK